jgi:hypothetical protein
MHIRDERTEGHYVLNPDSRAGAAFGPASIITGIEATQAKLCGFAENAQGRM